MGRRAGGLEGGVVAVDFVEVDRVRVAVVLDDVEAQAAGLVLARAAPVLERALQDLVTVFGLHADRHEQRSHARVSSGCGVVAYLIASSSTSKISVALGGMTPPAPRSP